MREVKVVLGINQSQQLQGDNGVVLGTAGDKSCVRDRGLQCENRFQQSSPKQVG